MIPELYDGKVVWFWPPGIHQVVSDRPLNRNFFGQPKEQVVSRYRRRLDTALGPGPVPVDHIERLWEPATCPRNRALPEGSRRDIGVPALTVINTDPDFYWLTNYIETVLSNELWKPTTTATIAFEYRKLLTAYAA